MANAAQNPDDDEMFMAPTAPADYLSLDQAVDIACEKLGLPLLGGPSGRGWSSYSTGQRCLELYRARHLTGAHDRGVVPGPLQIGGFFHTLAALFYAGGMGHSYPIERGLFSRDAGAPKMRAGRRPKAIEVPPTAADDLLHELRRMCDEAQGPGSAPEYALVLETARVFDAHTSAYDNGQEDITPLAVEWFAEHPEFRYTCRYDMIVRVGDHDPILPPGVVIVERKTARALTTGVTEGWWLDGEVLGQLMVWHAAGLDKVFGPLVGLVVDIVTKEKVPKTHRVLIPPHMPAVAEHERAMRQLSANLQLAQVSGFFPRSFSQCFENRGGRYERRCEQWTQCKNGEVSE